MKRPTISVIMPNFNHARFIGGALEAILSQSYKPEEVIVIDDNSTDNSVEVIQRFVNRYPVVRLVRNERNMGVFHNVNRFLEHTRGDYIFVTSADDMILPGLFEKSIRMLAEHPGAGLCYSDIVFLHDDTGVTKEHRYYLSDAPCYFLPDRLVEISRKSNLSIPSNTSILRRRAILECGGFNPDLKWSSDWFTTLVIAFRYGACYVPEPLGVFRIVPNSYCASGSKQKNEQRDIINGLLYLLKKPEYSDVLPLFMRSHVLSTFNSYILSVMLTNSDHRQYCSASLILRSLWRTVLKRLSPNMPDVFKKLYRHIISA